jgi:hypothetical protein
MLFKNPVRTSKRTPYFTITKINWLTLFKFNNAISSVGVDGQIKSKGCRGNAVSACFSHLVKDSVQWLAVVNTAMSSIQDGQFLMGNYSM